jgi:hypothetical protein
MKTFTRYNLNTHTSYAHYSVHRESIPKKFQQDDTLVQYFIISCKSLYMFRVKHTPIIRSSIKLYLQHLVLTNSVWPAVVVRLIHDDVCVTERERERDRQTDSQGEVY